MSPRILTLVIACDTEPFYADHRQQWRRYMNRHPAIQSFFIRHDPKLATEYYLEADTMTLWMRGAECGFKIYDKTAMALKWFLQNPEYADVEYVVRTNLSSFYLWNRLVAYLKTAPKTRYVSGRIVSQHDNVPYPSGCGMVFSRDVAEAWAYDPCPEKKVIADDWAFGYLIRRLGITITPVECIILPNEDTMVHFKDRILTLLNDTVFHIRLRIGTPADRRRYESANYAFLVDSFYD